jgi:hypothetical protein
MLRHSVAVLLVLAGLGGPSASTRVVQAQGSSMLLNAPLTHLGIVVPDIDKAAKGYADIFGIPVPEVKTISYDLPNGKQASLKSAYVPMPNFYIELMQPTTKSGPVYEHLKQFGIGIYMLGVGIDGNIDAVRAELESKGGKWTGGKKGGTYALVDFRPTPLGTTLMIGPTARPAMPAAPTTQTGLFGGRPISHVGFANTDAAASAKKVAEVFGMAPVAPRRFPPEGAFPYPPDMPWTKDGSVQTAMLQQGKPPIGLEVIQGVGEPNPWSHEIKMQKGVSAMHIAVGRGNIPRDEWLRIGQQKGGKWTNGGVDSFFAYLDWAETLGLVIE